MLVSERTLILLKRFEGLRLEAYQDIVGVWTIGFGHTGPEVHRGQTVTEAEATELLEADAEMVAKRVQEMLSGLQVHQCQFDALVLFAYNVGTEALRSSSLLRRLKAGDLEGAADEFPRWCHAGGLEVAGLRRRRALERGLFLGDLVA